VNRGIAVNANDAHSVARAALDTRAERTICTASLVYPTLHLQEQLEFNYFSKIINPIFWEIQLLQLRPSICAASK
jgi:hypothetical protein